MPDRAYVNRLRTSGGPSHQLLVLLDWHRVLTTVQAARAIGAPERTVRYRLDRLHEAGLVECVRPGRETGSSPRHWWLRPAGARLVAGAALALGRPTGMFAVHAASIAEVWLALVGTGPEAGIEVTSWRPDRAGWQEWDSSRAWSRRSRITPDAVAVLTVDGRPTTVLIEVDLATMTQTLLREKVARYLAYAADRAWEGVHPHCPGFLLLTTTATRAATFARAARSLVERYAADHDMTEAHAVPLIASCGLVRDPATAVTTVCWTTSQVEAGEFTLLELLAERAEAAGAATEWHARHDFEVRRRRDLDVLEGMGRREYWELLGAVAAEALKWLCGSSPAILLDTEPEFATQLLEWEHLRIDRGRYDARHAAGPVIAALEARHARLLAAQIGQVLAATDHVAAAEPRFRRLVARLAAGNLAPADDLRQLSTPPVRTFAQTQAELLADYLALRADHIDAQRNGLTRKQRKTWNPDNTADEFDLKYLVICSTCGLVVADTDPNHLAPYCPGCSGDFVPWTKRSTFTTYESNLTQLRRHTT